MCSAEAASKVAANPAKRIIADYLGEIQYEPALKLQQRLRQARAEGKTPDVILLLEHLPVLTTGRFRGEQDIIVSAEVLNREGIAVFHTNRGGSVTYHGPGQLVGYPILDLREMRLGVREYVVKLEAVIIRLLAGLGVPARRREDYPGVWVDGEKVCSVGIHVSRHITMHGFALNVNNDLRPFNYINPCGIKGPVITSLSKLLGYTLEVEAIIRPFLECFSAVFGLDYEWGLDKCLAILDVPSGSS